jgi:hypothetical protein
MTGRLRAQQLGIDPVQHYEAVPGLEEPYMDEWHADNFDDFGVEEDGPRATHQPRDDDPYVEVEDVLEGAAEDIVDLLSNPDVLQYLSDNAGPYWPIPEDHGIGRYVFVVNSIIEMREVDGD